MKAITLMVVALFVNLPVKASGCRRSCLRL